MQTVLVDQLVGQTIGAYRVERLLAHGKLSAVYLAQQLSEREPAGPVALTTFIIPEQFSRGARERFLARFRQDAEVLVTLRHRHLLPVYAYGEQYGYPYLVTPYMMHGSLADVLKQRGRCTPAYTLTMLEQIAASIDYAHSQGVVHGSLKPANIVFDEQENMLVAGFGLPHMLQLSGIVASDKPYAHLLNITEGMLGAPEYFAPELVKGQEMDARTDMYALGIVLFELLNGNPPFTGGTALEVAAQHIQKTVPSLHALHADVPIALELVINHALARKPQERFHRVSDLAEAFAQVYRGTQPLESLAPAQGNNTVPMRGVKGADEYEYTTRERESVKSWQLTPPVVTGKTPIVRSIPESEKLVALEKPGQSDSWQLVPPVVTGKGPVVKTSAPFATRSSEPRMAAAPAKPQQVPYAPVPVARPQPNQQYGWQGQQQQQRQLAQNGEASPWWSHVATSTAAPQSAQVPQAPAEPPPLRLPQQPALGTFQAPPAAFLSESMPLKAPKRRRSPDQGRRKVVTMLATGGVVAAGLLAFGGFELEHMMHNGMQATVGATTAQKTTNNQATTAKTNTTTTKKTGTPQTSGTNKGTTANNNTNKGTTPTANQDGHVIGSTKLAPNSAMAFTSPLNNQDDLLVHLSNNSFVAYDRACTHQNVPVNYDPATQKFVCPLHGSIFDPANNGAVLQGPAQRPLPKVTIKVNTDGTIAVV